MPVRLAALDVAYCCSGNTGQKAELKEVGSAGDNKTGSNIKDDSI